MAMLLCAQFTLEFKDPDGTVRSDLTREYDKVHARRFSLMLRVTTVLFAILNLALIAYDNEKFRKKADEADKFLTVVVLRVGILTPICVLIVLWTFFTKSYTAHPQWLALPALLLGGVVIAYSAVGDPNYGPLSVVDVSSV
jgi:fatty acid desaturase